MRTLIAFTFVLLTASLASAQSANIVSYTLETFAPGVSPTTGQPIQSTPYQATAAVCNQTAPTVPPGTAVNPVRFFFDDAANSGKVCVVQLGGSYLPALPNASGYTVYATQTDNLGQTSVRSGASNPFAKQGVPTTITNVKIVP